MNRAQVKGAADWFAAVAKYGDDPTREGISQTAVQVAPQVWAATNGHYAVLMATPPDLREWCATVPVDPKTPWPMAELALQAKAGELPDYCDGKIGNVRPRTTLFPDVARVLNLPPDKPLNLPDLGAALVEIDAAIARAKVDCAPTPEIAVLAHRQGLKAKLGMVVQNDLVIRATTDDMPGLCTPHWSLTAEITRLRLDGDIVLVHTETVELGSQEGKPVQALDLRYLRRFAKSGPWGGGTFQNCKKTCAPCDMRWGPDFMVLMPMRLKADMPQPKK
jgi:hypothetical protein